MVTTLRAAVAGFALVVAGLSLPSSASADWPDVLFMPQNVKYKDKNRGASQFIKTRKQGCRHEKQTLRVYDYVKDGHSISAEFFRKSGSSYVRYQVNINKQGAGTYEQWSDLCLPKGTYGMRTCVAEYSPYRTLACSARRFFAVV